MMPPAAEKIYYVVFLLWPLIFCSGACSGHESSAQGVRSCKAPPPSSKKGRFDWLANGTLTCLDGEGSPTEQLVGLAERLGAAG